MNFENQSLVKEKGPKKKLNKISKYLLNNFNICDKESLIKIHNFLKVFKLGLSDKLNSGAIIILSTLALYSVGSYIEHLSTEYQDIENAPIEFFDSPTNLINIPDIHQPGKMKRNYRIGYLSFIGIILAATFGIYRNGQQKELIGKLSYAQINELLIRKKLEEKVRQLEDAETINLQILESLQTVNNRLSTILDNMFDGVIEIQRVNGNIVIDYINSAATNIFGYEKSELLGNPLNLLLPLENRDNHDKLMKCFFEDTEVLPPVIGVQRKIYGKKKNGETFPIEIGLKRYYKDSKAIMIGFIRDITEKEKFIKKLEELNNELSLSLLESKKLNRFKDILISNFNHELRTPLNGIIGFAEFLETGNYDEDVKSFGKIIKENGLSLLNIIERIYKLAELKNGSLSINKETTDSHFIIESALHRLNPDIIRKSIKINNYAEDSILFLGDSELLIVAVCEIISNGIKYSNKEGTISIEHFENEGNLSISIKDNGEGIDKDFLEKIGTNFYMENDELNRTHQGGLGAGIQLVKEIINKHQGTMKVESKGKGKGTRVTISLPINPTIS